MRASGWAAVLGVLWACNYERTITGSESRRNDLVSSVAINPPSDLEATGGGFVGVGLTWRDNSDNEGGFRIKREDCATTFQKIADIGPNSQAYLDDAAPLPEKCGFGSFSPLYEVVVLDAKGHEAGVSNIAEIQAPIDPPSAPSNLQATLLVDDSQILLRWVDNSTNELGFHVERRQIRSLLGFTPWQWINAVGANVVSYVDPNVSIGNTYEYRVTAFHNTGLSDASNAVRITVTRSTAAAFWNLTGFALLPGIGVSPHLDPGIAVGSGNVLFVGVACYPYDPNCQGVFRSTDRGTTWSQHNTGLTSTNVNAIAATAAGHLVAGTNLGGVFRSVDGGNTWQATGLTIPHVTGVFSTRDAVYALDGFFCSGVYRSTDDGVSWTRINNDFFMCPNGFAAAPTGDTLYLGDGNGGVFRSIDRGGSWTFLNSGLPSVSVTWMAMNSQGHVFAATEGGGVFRSTDKAGTWTAVNAGLPTGRIYRLGINAVDHIFVGTIGGYGVFRSTDNGTSWQGGRSQSVVATVRANISYGFIQPSVCRGRPLSSRATASSCA